MVVVHETLDSAPPITSRQSKHSFDAICRYPKSQQFFRRHANRHIRYLGEDEYIAQMAHSNRRNLPQAVYLGEWDMAGHIAYRDGLSRRECKEVVAKAIHNLQIGLAYQVYSWSIDKATYTNYMNYLKDGLQFQEALHYPEPDDLWWDMVARIAEHRDAIRQITAKIAHKLFGRRQYESRG